MEHVYHSQNSIIRTCQFSVSRLMFCVLHHQGHRFSWCVILLCIHSGPGTGQCPMLLDLFPYSKCIYVSAYLADLRARTVCLLVITSGLWSKSPCSEVDTGRSNLFLLLCLRASGAAVHSSEKLNKWMALASMCHHRTWQYRWHMNPLDLMESLTAPLPSDVHVPDGMGLDCHLHLLWLHCAQRGILVQIPKMAPWWRLEHTAEGYWFNQ